MGTQTIETFKAKHFGKPKVDLKPSLRTLNIKQLKFLAAKHKVKVTGRVEETLLVPSQKPPQKANTLPSYQKL